MSAVDTAIANLVSRLEKVTQRLESIEKQVASGAAPAPASASSSASEGVSSVFVNEFDDLVRQFVDQYVELSQKIAPEVGQQAELFKKAVAAERNFLNTAANSKKPADPVAQNLFKPISDIAGQIIELKEKTKNTKFPWHLAAVAEGVAVLSWVLVAPTPGPHVAEIRGSSEFWSNKILKEYKGKDQLHVDWVNAFNGFLKEIQPYIKKHHTTGTSWNPRGGDAANFSASATPAADTGSDVPPPPGPAPPPPAVDNTPTKGSAPDMSNVFAALSKGEGVTSGLKKVTNDMKSKNRTDKSSVVPAKEVTEKPATGAAAKKPEVVKPPKFSLDGNKWAVEYQIGNKGLVIDQTEMRQTVYIYKCKNSTIQIKGKVNSVILDDCQKTAVVFENIVASFEVVNCQSVEVQVTGKVPSFAIDKTSGCQVYLSTESLEAEIVTSKSSEMNVLFPDSTGELIEVAIPEQYKTQVKNGKLHTETVAHV